MSVYGLWSGPWLRDVAEWTVPASPRSFSGPLPHDGGLHHHRFFTERLDQMGISHDDSRLRMFFS